MFGLGLPELLIILVIVVLLFGAGRLPQIGSGIGEGFRNFKNSMKEKDDKSIPRPRETTKRNSAVGRRKQQRCPGRPTALESPFR